MIAVSKVCQDVSNSMEGRGEMGESDASVRASTNNQGAEAGAGRHMTPII
jgi:hypothetical protein